MKEHSGKVMLGVVVLLVLGFVAYFLATHERITTTTFVPNKDARRHPFTALELILGNDTRQVAYHKTMDEVPSLWADTDTARGKSVFLFGVDTAQSTQFDVMLNWVQAGGHLVLFSDSEFVSDDETVDKNHENWQDYQTSENPLLLYLGIYNKALLDGQIGTFGDFGDDVPLLLPHNRLIVFGGTDSVFVADEFLSTHKEHTPYDYTAHALVDKKSLSTLDVKGLSDGELSDVVLFAKLAKDTLNPRRAVFDTQFGEGRLTVLKARTMLKNPYPSEPADVASPSEVAKFKDKPRWWRLLQNKDTHAYAYEGGLMYKDTAYFLEFLTQNQSEILIIEGVDKVGIVALMRQHTPFLVWSLVAGFFAILLRLPRQAGRREVLAKGDGSDVLAYLSGVGAYLWDSDLCAKQVSANRANLLDKIHVKLPAIHNASNEQKCTLIAQDVHLPPETVYLALYETWGDEDEFVLMTQAFWQVAHAYEF